MPFNMTSNSPTIIVRKKVKYSISSPKTIKNCINEIEKDEQFERIKLECTKKDFDKDPIHLKTILSTLRETSKGSVSCSEVINKIQYKSEEVCDFRNVGDLSHVSLIEETFIQIDDEKTNEKKDQCQQTTLDDTFEKNDSKEEIESEVDSQNISLLEVEIMMGNIQLEIELDMQKLASFREVNSDYMKHVRKIREDSERDLAERLQQEQQADAAAQDQLRQMQQKHQKDIERITESYVKSVVERRQEIAKQAEALRASEEAEQLNIRRGAAIDSLRRALAHFGQTLSAAQTQAISISPSTRETTSGQSVLKMLGEILPTVLQGNEQIVNQLKASSDISKIETEAAIVQNQIAEAFSALNDSVQALENFKTQSELAATTAAPTQSVNTCAVSTPSDANSGPAVQSLAPIPTPATTPTENTGTETASEAQKKVSPKTDSSLADVVAAFELLKKKYEEEVAAAASAKNSQMRPLLSRAVSLVNTLSSNRNNSSNRDKLQQILNMLEGLPCSIGSDTLNTSNNPSARAFFRESIAAQIVSLAHDKQMACMGVYASLFIRLWQFSPDVGALLMYHLFNTCPFLAPLPISGSSNEPLSEEQMDRAIGRRRARDGTREALDKYLGRMGAAAQLYGRIVSMRLSDAHPHGLIHGWALMARTLGRPPYPGVTAAILAGFLGVAGAPLLTHYGKQFHKMLVFIARSYLPQIEAETLDGDQSDVAALKTMLLTYEKSRTLPQISDGYSLSL